MEDGYGIHILVNGIIFFIVVNFILKENPRLLGGFLFDWVVLLHHGVNTIPPVRPRLKVIRDPK